MRAILGLVALPAAFGLGFGGGFVRTLVGGFVQKLANLVAPLNLTDFDFEDCRAVGPADCDCGLTDDLDKHAFGRSVWDYPDHSSSAVLASPLGAAGDGPAVAASAPGGATPNGDSGCYGCRLMTAWGVDTTGFHQ